MPLLSRRQLLVGLTATPLALTLACSGPQPERRAQALTRPLPIPPLADSTVGPDGTRVFRLRAMAGETDMLPGVRTATWGFNGSILGPTLRARRGESVAVQVENALTEPTTVHWHGMHVPAQCDGGPHQTVPAGGRWEPRWQVRQPAATLWYHPHPHGVTEKHIYRGLAGMFLIDDDADGTVGLPRDYGVDDIPLIIQDRRFTPAGALDESDPTDIGLLGDTIVTNGIAGAHLTVRTEQVRLRILNGSGGRLYNLGFSDGRAFHIVAGDGGLLTAPVPVTRVQLSPGERAEIIVDCSTGNSAVLQSFPIDGRAGLDAEEAARFGVGDSFTILRLQPEPTLRPSAALPAALAALPALPDPARSVHREFELQWFMINRNRMDMNRIDFQATVDTDEIWTVRNVDNWPHNFHVHDTQFRVIDIDGMPPPPQLAGYKDTVYTPPGQRIRLAVRFSDYTDPTFPYMYHCHLALHEDQGMMGQFLVLDPGQQAEPMAMDMPHAMR
ncbi:multicopper oxidase domain-containing protein [Mycobacterium sp. ITM-2016-00316]|uniref:multicopper oxidase family protein n=1 Tax=Mycobacterium sp. ITM-2016-00316 TaxID=2099695 RepID=UPI000CF92971|nr:multicopper oxidase domain-containing protein [Mycobacterium sp. ITM-2016-00316]WNG81904.1 multicopper oxidase domain-containing protein [Mycobacterium sp. ITM-2016-00316]